MAVDLISRIAEKARANSTAGSSLNLQNNSDLIVSLAIHAIKYHPKNHLYFRDLDKAMKDKLMEDMRDNGQINPIIVKKNEDPTYTVLAGHQRLIAARRLNWQQIKAIVIEVSEYEAEKLLIRDNLFRRHMGGMELARALDAYSRLSNNQTRKSIRQIAEDIGENRNTVHFYMKLNSLIPELQQLVEDKKLTPTAAQVFTSMSEEDQRKVWETLGEEIVWKKKKELEEEIHTKYVKELTTVNEEKVRIEDERNKLLIDTKNKDEYIDQYKGQMEAYRQQAEHLLDKAFVADSSSEVREILFKLHMIQSLAGSFSLDNIRTYDLSTLSHIMKKYEQVYEFFSTGMNLLSSVFNTISTQPPVENVDN